MKRPIDEVGVRRLSLARFFGGNESGVRKLLTLSLATVGILAGQLVVSPLLPRIIADFGIPSALAGLAMTSMWATAALCMYPGGHYSDRLDRRSVLLAAVGMVAIGLAVAFFSPSFPVFVGALIVVGIGVGFFEPTSVATVSDLFVDMRGRAFGITSGSYNLGSVVAAGLGFIALWLHWWRVAFLPLVILLIGVWILIYHWDVEHYGLRRIPLEPLVAMQRLLGNVEFRNLIGLFCLQMFLWQGTISFYPTLLSRELGMSSTVTTAAFAWIFVLGLVTTPIAGAMGDRIGHYRVGAVTPVVGLAGLSMVLLVPGLMGLALGTTLLSIGLVNFWPVMTAQLMKGFGADSLGADYGITRAIFYGVGSLGPTYVGVVADTASLTLAYAGLASCFLLSVVGFLWVR